MSGARSACCLALLGALSMGQVLLAADDTPPRAILVPGGHFEMGAEVEDDHRPPHNVHVEEFLLDCHEATNAEYAEFCDATKRDLPQFWGIDELWSGPAFPDHPVVGVTWHDALAFCQWRGMRLPTEAEWEYAARGGVDGKKYPWGDEPEPEKARFNPSDGPAAVGSFSPNGYGLYDMAGNVGEWVADWYDPDYYEISPVEDPRGPETGKYKSVRGGGWRSGPYCNRVYRRLGLLAYWVDINVGFRCAADTTAPGAEAGAHEILAAAKTASGGEAWDGVTHLHLKASIATSGFEGTFESWEDLLGGRSVGRADLGIVKVANGFDGTTPWEQDPSGDVTEQGSEENLQSARNQAFLAARGFWYPNRWPAETVGAEEREADSRSFHVLELIPEGGRRLEIWFDTETHLPARIVEVEANTIATTYLADYRVTGKLALPHHIRTSNGDTRYDTVVEVTSIEINPQLAESFFDIPQVVVDDFVIADDATSVTLPFELLNNHIYVEASVNDAEPSRFLVDTGGANLLTESAADAFGIESQGAIQGRGAGEGTVDISVAQLGSFTFGGITLSNQTFYVIPLAEVQAAEGVDFDGLIGFEAFKRFVVEIDYAARRLTLTRPEAFTTSGRGVSVPFTFDDRTPVVEGAIASVPATFAVDTGSRSTLDIFPAFAAANDLEQTLEPRFEALNGWGVGGGVRSKLAAGATLRLGNVEIPDVVTAFSQQQEGAFADKYLAGNIGGGVLKRFTVTFDYTNKVVVLEPNADFNQPDPYDRSGMWLNRQADAFKVFDVVAGGAAEAAGVQVGDLVIACDGTESSKLSLPALRERFRHESPGTKFILTVVAEGGEREVELELRDLLAD